MLHPADLHELAARVADGEFVWSGNAASFCDALDQFADTPKPKASERMGLLLRAAQLHHELALISESLAGEEVNPPTRQRKPRIVHARPAAQPTDIDVARAKKIMRERGMIG